jgi:hypothetical protein
MNKRNSRDLFPGVGAGKGDGDRSPGWRERYDEIDFQRPPVPAGIEAKAANEVTDYLNGFRRVSPSRIRKVYGSSAPIAITSYIPEPATTFCTDHNE